MEYISKRHLKQIIILPAVLNLFLMLLSISLSLSIFFSAYISSMFNNLGQIDDLFMMQYSQIAFNNTESLLDRYKNYLILQKTILSNTSSLQINPNFTINLPNTSSEITQLYKYYTYDISIPLNKSELYSPLIGTCTGNAIAKFASIYEIFPDETIFENSLKENISLCQKINCLYTSWYINTINYNYYLSSVFNFNGTNVQMLCINMIYSVLCAEFSINYPDNLFITNTNELIWHQNMSNNLQDSVFGMNDYPFYSLEVLDFTNNIIPLLQFNSSKSTYIYQGQIM